MNKRFEIVKKHLSKMFHRMNITRGFQISIDDEAKEILGKLDALPERPRVIHSVLLSHHIRFVNSVNGEKSIFTILDYAVKHPEDSQAQENAVEAMKKMVEVLEG